MNGITFNIEITLSKILAYLTLGAGIAVSIILKDPMSFGVGVGAASAMVLNKQYQDRVKVKYENGKTEHDES